MRIALVLLALSMGCVTPPPAKCQPSRVGLSFEEAKEIVAAFEARQIKQSGPNALRDPKSLDDVLEILKLDDLTLRIRDSNPSRPPSRGTAPRSIQLPA